MSEKLATEVFNAVDTAIGEGVSVTNFLAICRREWINSLSLRREQDVKDWNEYGVNE